MNRAIKSQVLLIAVLAALGACKTAGKPRAHSSIGADGAVLRDAFNADVGKVRVVMLVAPS